MLMERGQLGTGLQLGGGAKGGGTPEQKFRPPKMPSVPTQTPLFGNQQKTKR